MKYPSTLQQAIRYFTDFENCQRFMIEMRWPDGKVRCPTCQLEKVTYLEKARLWKCYAKHPRAKFSLKVGTIFEDSPIGLDKWLPAMWLIANCKNGISSYEMARGLGVTQKTAWFMDHRIRLAMQSGNFEKVAGEFEVDESFIDAWRSYNGLSADYVHQVIDHAEKYVDGEVHTNGIENFWSLLKRGLKGTYISVEPFHLFRGVASSVLGRRLTYAELTGKTESRAEPLSA